MSKKRRKWMHYIMYRGRHYYGEIAIVKLQNIIKKASEQKQKNSDVIIESKMNSVK